jgi:two-component system, NarL family, response regulator
MTAEDEVSSATQVVVYEARRLIRQSLSIWLSGQESVALAGTASSIAAIAQICEHQRVDVVLLGLFHDYQRIMAEAQAFAGRYPNVRFIAITDGENEDVDRQLARSMHAVVNASAGAANLLRVICAGATVRAVTEPIELSGDTTPLTPREAEVLALVGQGNTADDISDQLGISTSTIANHKERIYSKLDANNQAHAVAVAVAAGIISPEIVPVDSDADEVHQKHG